MDAKLIISDSTCYPVYKDGDARLLALKNSVLSAELDEANAEVKRLRKVVATYQKRMDRAYTQAIMYQMRQIHPLYIFTMGFMSVLAITGVVLMVI